MICNIILLTFKNIWERLLWYLVQETELKVK